MIVRFGNINVRRIWNGLYAQLINLSWSRSWSRNWSCSKGWRYSRSKSWSGSRCCSISRSRIK
jgi:hypothetical protein